MTSKVRSLPLDDFRRSARLALVLAVLLAMLSLIVQAALVQPARAQSVEDQLQRMQRELSDLQRQVYTNGTPPAAASGGASGGGGVTPTQAARIQLQLDQFESQMAELTGRIEDMNFRIQSVTDRLDKLVADVDLRLRNLEQGGLPPVGAADDGAAMAGDSGQMATAPAASGAAPSSAPRPGTIGSISENDLNSFQQQGAQQQGAQQQGAQQQGAQQQGAQQQGAEQQGSSTTAPTAQQSAAAPAAAAALPGGSPQEQYDYAFGLLRQANYAGAEQAFSAFLAEHPQNALAGNAKYWLGETYYVRGNYQQAAVTFAEGFEAYPNNSKAPDNLLKLGMSLASLGSTQDACGTFTVLLDRYADAPATILSRAQRESQRLGCQ